MNRDWTGKLRVMLLSAERNCTRSTLFGGSNRDASWENEGKIHEKKMCKRVFFVNLQAGISQLHYKLTSSQIVFRDFKYILRFIFSNSYLSFLHKMLEKHLWNNFLLYLVVEIWNKLLSKRGFLKNSKFSDKHKEQSSGSVQSKDVLKNSVKFTGKHLCRILLFNKVAGWKP